MLYKFYRIEWTDKNKSTHLHYVNTFDEAITLLNDIRRQGYVAKREIVYLRQSSHVQVKSGLFDI